jgi:uncharacterized protein YjbJ (UPF0337 family)
MHHALTHSRIRVFAQHPKGNDMGKKDKASNKLQDAKGKVKETVGSAVGNKHLETEGKVDQTKAGLKDAGESVKDAASQVKDALTEH